jgi:hypothetical protein
MDCLPEYIHFCNVSLLRYFEECYVEHFGMLSERSSKIEHSISDFYVGMCDQTRDQFGLICATWAVVYSGHFFANFTSSQKIWSFSLTEKVMQAI